MVLTFPTSMITPIPSDSPPLHPSPPLPPPLGPPDLLGSHQLSLQRVSSFDLVSQISLLTSLLQSTNIASSEQKKELLHRLSSILSIGAESSTFLAAAGVISNCISGLHSLAYLLPVHAYCIYSYRCSYNMFLNWQLYTGFTTPSPVTVIENLLPQHTSLPISS